MNVTFCKRQMSVLQRRSMQQLGGVMGLTAALSVLSTTASKSRQMTGSGSAAAILLSIVSVLPVLAAIRIVGQYLRSEPDEFVRALVVRALLWGLAVTMAGDAVLGALLQVYGGHIPLVLFNADLLFAGAGLSFRLLQRSYR